jgi:hypothetical protein
MMPEELISVRQKIEIPFQYTAGPAMTRFLEGLKEKAILAGQCSQCGRSSVPPLSFCGRCWRPVTTFAPLTGEGVLVSYTKSDADVVYGLILLDGADSSMVHRLDPSGPDKVVGSRVKPVWRAERAGSILDIEHFVVMD